MPRLPRRNVCCPLSGMVVLVTLLFSGLSWAAGWGLPAVAMGRQTDDLSQLPLSFPVQSPEVAAYFQEIARPQDIASVPPAQLFLLSQDSVGQKMVAFRSFADAQRELDTLTSPVDMVMYNPEHWELTPEDEQQDLPATVQQFAEFVHERDLGFMFAPDRRYAEEHLDQVAPDIDAVLLQGQRLQHDPQTFATWVLGLSGVAHAANPDIQVFVQVGATRGTASEMYAAIQTVAEDIDGIAVWSMPRTLHVLQEFVALVRESPPIAEVTSDTTLSITRTVSVTIETTAALPSTATAGAVPDERSTVTPVALLATPASAQGVASTPTGRSGESATSSPSPSPVALPSVMPREQAEPAVPNMGWVTDVLLFVGGVGFGLAIGFFLGWRLGRGSRD
jgi:hypothetical protein